MYTNRVYGYIKGQKKTYSKNTTNTFKVECIAPRHNPSKRNGSTSQSDVILPNVVTRNGSRVEVEHSPKALSLQQGNGTL